MYIYIRRFQIAIGALIFIALCEFLFVFIIVAAVIITFHRIRFIIVGNSFQLPFNRVDKYYEAIHCKEFDG